MLVTTAQELVKNHKSLSNKILRQHLEQRFRQSNNNSKSSSVITGVAKCQALRDRSVSLRISFKWASRVRQN